MYLLEPEPKYGASCKPQNMFPSCFSLALALHFKYYSQFEPYSLNPKKHASWMAMGRSRQLSYHLIPVPLPRQSQSVWHHGLRLGVKVPIVS